MISFFALLAFACGALADDKFSVDDVTLPQNGEADVVVRFSLDEGSTCSGYTFWLQVPQEMAFVTYMKNDKTYVTYTTGDCYDEPPTLTPNIDGNYLKVGCFTANSDPIIGLTGILVTFRIKAVGTLPVGATYTGTLSNATISAENGSTHNVADATFTITIAEPVNSRLVLDENATTAPEDATGVDVLVKRTIVADVWNTLCLPFSMTAEQVTTVFGNDVRLAEFTNWEVDGNNVKLTFTEEATAIEKNVPCLIKVTEGLTEFTVDGVDIEPERNSKGKLVDPYVEVKVGRKYGYFTGTYTVTDLPVNSLFLNNDRLWFCTGSNTTKAFRGYFEIDDVEYSAETRLSIAVDSEVTGITERNDRHYRHDGGTYDLQGRKVNSKQKGVYIENGKKVVVK